MATYQLDLFLHNLSVKPEFRKQILAGNDDAWTSIALTADERTALESGDISWLYLHGANDFLLHNLARFQVGGLTVERYATAIRQHNTIDKSAPE